MKSAAAPSRRARRQCLQWLGAGLLGSALGAARAAAGALPASTSLQDELARALRQGQPLVVMVSLEGCPWCHEVRQNYLAPMHARDGMPVVQIDMRSMARTLDVQGQPRTHDALVRGWGVRIAPTVLFLGPGGQELADRLTGSSPDFYAAYLDRRLTQARQALAGQGGKIQGVNKQ